MISSCQEENRFAYYHTRVLYLYDDVMSDTSNATVFIDQMFELHARSNEPITLLIDSHGGMATQMFMVVDTMRAIMAAGTPVITQVMGIAASAGCIIATCGAAGHRWISPLSRTMIHQPQMSGVVSVDATDFDIERGEAMAVKKQFTELLIETTGKQTRSEITKLKADLERDRWFSATEALAYGICDNVGISPTVINAQLAPLTPHICTETINARHGSRN